MKEKTTVKIFALAFIIAELILGILIQTVGGGELSFSSIVLAFLFSVFVSFSLKFSTDALFTSFALLFTVCADFCLVILDPREQFLSMVFFSTVQIFYFLRLIRLSSGKRENIIHFSVRGTAIILALLLTAIVLGESADALSLISMFYYANLIVNLAFSVKHIKTSVMLPIGLLCFILCDTLVGLSELGSLYMNFSEDSIIYKLTHTELNLIWLFYVPSQTLISLSPLEINAKSKNS